MKKIIIALGILASLAGSGAEAKIFLKVATVDSATLTGSADLLPEKGLFLVEWKTTIQEKQKAALQRLGIEILGYIPDNVLLVKGKKEQALQSQKFSFVQSVLPYSPEYKVEPELGRESIMSAPSMDVTVELAPGARLAKLKSKYGQAVIYLAPAQMQARLTLAQVWQLAAEPEVLWIERNIPLKIFSFDAGVESATDTPAFTGYESGTKILNVDAAYGAGFHGEGMITGYADTGLDKGDLNTLIPDFQGQVAAAKNIALYGSSWGDPNGHGTHVAGSIVGNGASSEGKIRGGAFAAKIVVEGMWSDMFNNIFPPEMAKIFTPAYESGARIHSNSWGGSANGRYDNNALAVDQFMFTHPDMLIVFAAGNDGQDADKNGVVDEGSLASPGSAKNVLTVGASKNYILEGGIQKPMKDLREGATKWGVEPLASSLLSDDPRGMAAFSSRGPAADGRIKPDIVAPGTNIVSAKSTNPKADASNGAWGDSYVFLNGTSMATPLTNGAVTLMRQYLLAATHSSTVSAALIKAAAANTAFDLFPGQFGSRAQGQEQPVRRPNNHEGWGRVDLSALVGKTNLQFFDERVGLGTGQSKSFDQRVDGTKSLRITLAYTDAPGTASAAKALVNDLDLVVIDPNGNRHYPNHLSTKDSVNNMEEVDIDTLSSGVYRISVEGANIPQGINGAQPYALVINGAN